MLNLKYTEFYYEPRLNGTNKNPECSVILENGFRINVEAKCPSHKQFIANPVLSSSNKKESNDVVLKFRSAPSHLFHQTLFSTSRPLSQ